VRRSTPTLCLRGYMSDFHAHLKTHLGFLARSCIAYDQGHLEEALRMAVSLRVMFHDTQSSTSLLRHLGAKGRVRLKSTFVLQVGRFDLFSLRRIGGTRESGWKELSLCRDGTSFFQRPTRTAELMWMRIQAQRQK
jgi:hypothetical protein